MCYLEGEYNDSHIVEYVLVEAVKVVDFSAIVFPPLGKNAVLYLKLKMS